MNEQTKDEWRELGFFYDYEKSRFCWRFIGSRQGLFKFCDILNAYAADERNAPLSEHEHYGPYLYLKLITWNKAEITAHAIFGTFGDLEKLSELIKQNLENAIIGDNFVIDEEYSPDNEAKLFFEVKEDDFDVAKADVLLWR